MSDDNLLSTLTLDLPAAADAAPPVPVEDRTFSLLGVRITDVTRGRALALLTKMLQEKAGPARCAFFVNAHTLNLAAADSDYRDVLNAADYVFGDGTGVRWAARLNGLRVRDNLAGTDLVPQLLRATAAEGHRYFLLGGDEATIARTAATAATLFPGWTLAGCHHGYPRQPRSSPPPPSARSTARSPTSCSSAWAIRARSSGSTSIAANWKSRSASASAAC